MQATQRTVLEQLHALCRELDPGRDVSGAGPSSHLEGDFGIGSLERVELLGRLESAFHKPLPDQEILQAQTVRDLVRAVEHAQQAPPPTSAAAPPRAEPRSQGPPPPLHATSLVEVLVYQAQQQPDAVALHFPSDNTTLTYAQLLRTSCSIAAGLADRGVRPGDKVAIMLPTCPEFFPTFFGALLLGAAPVPLYPPMRLQQAEDFVKRQSLIVENAEARLLVTSGPLRPITQLLRPHAPTLEEIVTTAELLTTTPFSPSAVDPTAVALIQYTSGSTASPRGVVLEHTHLLANLRWFGDALRLRHDDLVVCWLPLYHDMGLIGLSLGATFYGIPLVLLGPEQFLARPSRWLRAISDHRGTITAAPNFAYEICANKLSEDDLRGLDLSCWRVAINGAEPVRPDTLRRFADRFAQVGFRANAFMPSYGLAEATLAISISSPLEPTRIDRISRDALERESRARAAAGQEDALEFVACGPPLPEVQVRIADRSGRALEERMQGEIHFRTAAGMRGYYRNPQATSEVIREDGWYDSGDLGYLADGQLYPTGRRKALILKGGRNLLAEEVEQMVAQVEGIRRGCVTAFGVPSGGTEDLVVVAETRQAGAGAHQRLTSAIRQQVSQALGVVPDRVVLCAPGTIPKTPSGKVRRSACRERLLSGTLQQRTHLVGQALRLLSSSGGWLARRTAYVAGRGMYGLWCGSLCAFYWLSLQAATWRGRQITATVAHVGARLLLRLAGFRLILSGPRNLPRDCMVVCNHTSMIDPIVLLAALPAGTRFVAAPWVVNMRLLRNIIHTLGCLKVTRGDARKAAEQVSRMQQELQEGGRMLVFPEGGMEGTPGLHPFALGPFRAAAAAQVAVIPVAMQGTRAALRWGRTIPQPGELRVTFAPLLPPPSGDRLEDAAVWANQAREAIAPLCGEPLSSRRLVRED